LCVEGARENGIDATAVVGERQPTRQSGSTLPFRERQGVRLVGVGIRLSGVVCERRSTFAK
jgi:hypothetical protein